MNDMSEAVADVASLAPSDLVGLFLGVIGALLVLGGAYYASVLINRDPRYIEPRQKLTAIALLLFGLVLSLAGLSGALWTELTEDQPPVSAGDSSSQ
jgi:hypothetical protein